MPTTLLSLVAHRDKHAGAPEWQRVWFFHSHALFDHTAHERVQEAAAFRERIAQTFASTSHVEVHSFVPRPAGPFPRGSFEVLFTRDGFTEYVTWLSFERPEAVDILVHPLTRWQVRDHGDRALWLGRRLDLDMSLLQRMDDATMATSRSEEDVIEATKKH
jgi:aromatic ring-cleaving dioxygenase